MQNVWKTGVMIAVALSLFASGCTSHKLRHETPRWRDEPPRSDLLQAVEKLKSEDPDASVTFFNGHVDSFATTAKPTVPDYALPILRDLGLATEARTPLKLAAPTFSGDQEKSARDLDADLDLGLPILAESEIGGDAVRSEGVSDSADTTSGELPREAARRKPARDPQKLLDWQRPDDELVAAESKAAAPILRAFLERHAEVFQVDFEALDRTLRATSYQVGPYVRRAAYEQYYSGEEKLLYGRILVQFDVNWNVVGISRMITSPRKLAVPALSEYAVDKEKAVAVAAKAFDACREKNYSTARAERAVDAVRKVRVWDVELVSTDGDCHWRSIIDAATGQLLNVTDLIDRAFTDAKVNRWYFPGGDLFDPHQIVSTGIYTRNDRRLEHDFFYVMNDHRCEGDPETTCSETTSSSLWCEEAHGSTNGDSLIRATRRTNRDFDQYYPSGSSETFAETHTYYWARSFSQWLKPSLDALGVLPNSASNYPRVLIITNACRDGSVHNSSYSVTTDDNKGEGGNVIRLAHRFGSSNHNKACESGGCVDNPSNIHHELNHFYLKRYYDVGSDLDCSGANQLKFTHEGILGTAVPHAYWHYYYGVGYDPSSTDKLYFSHTNIGRVHTDDSDRMRLGDYLCVDYTDDPYRAGRVVGQALWEFYHGKKVSGSTISGTWYPSTDKDFNVLVYWAAELQASSTYKDRYEFANRVMEILDKYSNWSSSGKQDYCDIFDHHSLDNFIEPEYCN